MVVRSRQGPPVFFFLFKNLVLNITSIHGTLGSPIFVFRLPQVSAAYGPFWGWMEGYSSWVSGVTDNSLCERHGVDQFLFFGAPLRTSCRPRCLDLQVCSPREPKIGRVFHRICRYIDEAPLDIKNGS